MVKFQEKWLGRTDVNEDKVGEWGAKSSKGPSHMLCITCNSHFVIDKGFEKVNQHAKGKGHQDKVGKYKAEKKSQMKLTTTKKRAPNVETAMTTANTISSNSANAPTTMTTANAASTYSASTSTAVTTANTTSTNSATTSVANANADSDTDTPPDSEKISLQGESKKVDTRDVKIVTLFNPRQDSLKAELLWCLEVVASQNSFNSCQGKPELFKKMFPGKISEKFALSPKKVAYLITEALGPYFESELLNDIKNDETTYSIQFDETNNKK